MEGYGRTEAVTLTQPLAGRAIVNGPSGGSVVPFLATSLLNLDPGPEGWSLNNSRGGSTVWNRTWTAGTARSGPPFTSRAEEVTVSQAMPGTPTAGPAGPTPIAVTVRGTAGTIDGDSLNRTLRWNERGTTVLVRATHAALTGVQSLSFTDEELVAVAKRLV